MRILLGVHQFFPEFCAGTETLVLRTAHELRRRDNEVRILAGASHDPDRLPLETYEYDGLLVTRLDDGPTSRVPGRQFVDGYVGTKHRDHIERVLAEFVPDRVHIFHLMRVTLSVVYACRSRALPLYITLTDYWVCCPTAQMALPGARECVGPDVNANNCLQHLATLSVPFARFVPAAAWPRLRRLLPGGIGSGMTERLPRMREALALAAAVFVPTAAMRDTLVRNGFSGANVRISPYGIDLDDHGQCRCESMADDGGRVLAIGFIGSLNEVKGATVLLDAIHRLGSYGNFEFRIYGSDRDSPGYASKLRLQARGLPNVTFSGTFPPNDVFAVLRTMDILVVPSLWRENSPLIVQQAQALGIPVVGSQVDGIASLISDEVNGLLFTPGDAVDLAKCLKRFREEPELRSRLAQHAVRPRGIQEYVSELEACYASAN